MGLFVVEKLYKKKELCGANKSVGIGWMGMDGMEISVWGDSMSTALWC